MDSESFPFNKLPVELQLMVWHHARSDIDQVIAGDLELSTTTLFLRGQNIDHAKDYLRLLSTCHLSRQEVLCNPPVFMVEEPDLWYLCNVPGAVECLTIKHWHFGGVFTDILIDHVHLDGLSEGQINPGHADLVGKTLLFLFGPTVRRVHLWSGDEWDY